MKLEATTVERIQYEKLVLVKNKLLILLGVHLFFTLMYIIRQLSLIESFSEVPDVYHPTASVHQLLIHIFTAAAALVYIIIYILLVAREFPNGILIFGFFTIFVPIFATASLAVNMFTPKFFKNGFAEEPIYLLILIVGATLLGVVLQIFIIKLSFQLSKQLRIYKAYVLSIQDENL